MYENRPWLHHYGETPKSLHYPDLSMYGMFKKNRDQRPKTGVLVFFGRKITRALLDQKIIQMSRSFARQGIAKGDMVIVCLPNIPQAVVSFYALNRLGAIPAPIHPLSAAPEIEAYAKLVSAKTAITLDGFFPRFEGIMQSAGFKKVIVCSLKSEMGPVTKIGFSLGPGRKIKPVKYTQTVVDWAKLESGKDLPELDRPDPIPADEMALILF
jgi:long-chain acyl-CoA synthetase